MRHMPHVNNQCRRNVVSTNSAVRVKLRAYIRASISLSVSGSKPAGNGRVYSVIHFENLPTGQILRWTVRLECGTLRLSTFDYFVPPPTLYVPRRICSSFAGAKIWILTRDQRTRLVLRGFRRIAVETELSILGLRMESSIFGNLIFSLYAKTETP